jgi:hypothetical protein
MPLKWISKKVKHPCKLATELSTEQLQELVDTIQDILWVEVESRGDFWAPDKSDDEWTTGSGVSFGEGQLQAIKDVMELNGLKPTHTECKR